MRHALVLSTILLALAGCRGCNDPVGALPQATDQVDVFDQKQAAQVDVLWMVDNSGSMAAEQNKLAERFNEFFSQLIRSAVDYHIGIITSDPAENGVLRAYNGPAVTGCDPGTCRFITKDVPCDNPDVDISGLTDETAIENKLAQECPAQLVFRKLVRVGTDGSSFEEGFPQAAAALGVKDVDAQGVPTNTPPAENAGFLRQDASLYIVFVSDEDEGAKNEGTPIRYYQRLFEGMKGAGNENKVAIAAITGYPFDNSLPPIDDVCGVLATTFDSSTANDDARAPGLVQALRDFNVGCEDLEGEQGDPNAHAETGGRYIELACRTGGVVANMCEADYSRALDALGANAAGLLRKFTLSKTQPEIAFGRDCTPMTDDDEVIDCDDDGKTDGALDGPICVKAVDINEQGEPHLVPQDAVEGWVFEAPTNSVRFDGGFIPKPGSSVKIQYKIRARNDLDTCGAGT
jgi:hypothetical protein